MYTRGWIAWLRRSSNALPLVAFALAGCASTSPRDGEPDVIVTSESDGIVRTSIVPEGTVMNLTLDRELSVEKNRRGDPFTTTLTDPVIVDGRVLVPRGAKVHGHVTAVQDAGDSEEEVDVLKLHFTRVTFEGETFPVEIDLIEANPRLKSNRGTGETIAGIAAGTALGAVLGRIITGDDEGTLIGAAVGAAAGTAIVLGTADEKAVLPEGSGMKVRTRTPIRVTA